MVVADSVTVGVKSEGDGVYMPGRREVCNSVVMVSVCCGILYPLTLICNSVNTDNNTFMTGFVGV
jgi:hypothetical protein